MTAYQVIDVHGLNFDLPSVLVPRIGGERAHLDDRAGNLFTQLENLIPKVAEVQLGQAKPLSACPGACCVSYLHKDWNRGELQKDAKNDNTHYGSVVQHYETQNYLESRVAPAAPVVAQVHGTPGYPIGFTVGLTFHVWNKAL